MRFLSLRYLAIIIVSISLPVFATDAEQNVSMDAHGSTEQLVREEMQLLLTRLTASGALGTDPEQLKLNIHTPAQQLTNLGLLVDSTNAENARQGLRVLGISPNGSAQRMGVHSGDVLLAVNDISLRALGADTNGRALAAQKLKETVEALPEGAPLKLQLQRDGNTINLSTPLQKVHLPAMQLQLGGSIAATVQNSAPASDPATMSTKESCGRISDFDVAPRSQHLYHARILQIDGKNAGPTGQHSFSLNIGTHQILIAENIPTQVMDAGEMASLRRSSTKVLDVTIKPGITALIAARFNRDNTDWIKGGYWDPLVWRETSETCP